MRHLSFRDRFLALFFRRNWPGFETLYRRMGSPAIFVITRYGSVAGLDPRESADCEVLLSGYRESEMLRALRPFLREKAVFWDAGGSGLHAVTAKLAVPELVVHAFESGIDRFQKLLANVSASVVNVHPWPVGLHNAPDDGTGENILTRGETFIDGGFAPTPDILKIEGDGISAITGMGKYLSKIEAVAVTACDKSSQSQAETLLTRAGFEIHPSVSDAWLLATRKKRNRRPLREKISTT